jgi:hypothetical protein
MDREANFPPSLISNKHYVDVQYIQQKTNKIDMGLLVILIISFPSPLS